MNLKDNMMYGFMGWDCVCGECLKKGLKETQEGKFTGDEKVTEKMIEDCLDMSEPIQCSWCNKQNDAYEELGTDEDG